MAQDYRPATYSRGIRIGKPTWTKVYGKKRSRRKFGTWRNPWVHTEYARPPECSEEELQRRYDNMTDNTYVNQHVSKVEHRRGKEITHY